MGQKNSTKLSIALILPLLHRGCGDDERRRRDSLTQALWLKAHHEMGPMGLGQRFPFALERDDVRARLGNRLR